MGLSGRTRRSKSDLDDRTHNVCFMAIKRRTNKKRAELTAGAIAFLEGRPSFTQFKDDAYLADL